MLTCCHWICRTALVCPSVHFTVRMGMNVCVSMCVGVSLSVLGLQVRTFVCLDVPATAVRSMCDNVW